MRENNLQIKRTANDFKGTISNGCNLFNNNSTFFSPIYTFASAGNIIVYRPNQGSIGEKYFIHIIYKGKDADSGWK